MRKIKTPIIIVPFSESPGSPGGSTPPDNGG